MRKFKLKIIECGTLKVVSERTIQAKDIDEARRNGTTKYGKPNHFVGAESYA